MDRLIHTANKADTIMDRLIYTANKLELKVIK